VENQKAKARSLLLELEKLVVPDRGPWLFGLDAATALDAHLVVFIARLRDVGREELIPHGISLYGDRAMETPEWRNFMDGRRTMNRS